MIISRKWLNSYLEPNLNDIDDKAFAARMTMTGSKVESIERFGDYKRCLYCKYSL